MDNRLIILTFDFVPNNGGIARLCSEIRNQCIATGTPYQVITAVDGPPMDDVVRLPGRRGLSEWRMLRYVRRHVKPDDVVLTGMFHPEGLLAQLGGCHRVYHLAHGAELLPGKSWFRHHVWEHYRRWLLAKATRVIANSHYTADLAKHCSPQAEVMALPLAVDTGRFRPTRPKHADGLLHLCSISRLEKFKAHDFVIETIASLPAEYRSRIRLEIAGKGAYRTELERLVEQHRLGDIVTFLGFVADDDLCDFYSRNDAFILCTREEPGNRNVEGFGLVFTEAQACGTPAIGTRAGGIPDAVSDGNGGWLIEQDNGSQLARLLMHMVDHPDEVARQGLKARARVSEQCTWDKYFKALTSIVGI